MLHYSATYVVTNYTNDVIIDESFQRIVSFSYDDTTDVEIKR